MKKYLLPTLVITVFSILGSISYLVLGSDATASTQLTPDLRHSICVKNWNNLKKNRLGEARWIAGGHIGVRYLSEGEWIKSCMER